MAGSSNGTGSKVRFTFQWSRLSEPWMTKYLVADSGQSATNHAVGEVQSLFDILPAAVGFSLRNEVSNAAETVATVATAVLCPAAAAV